jgi:ribosome-associated translation inhibitor RaiA
MEIYFKNIHEAISQRILNRTEVRLKKLEKLSDEGGFESHAYVEIGKATGAHNSGDIWQTIINVDIKGERLRAEATADHPERATMRALAEMKKELRRTHSKEKMLRRRQHSVWKSFHNFGMPT